MPTLLLVDPGLFSFTFEDLPELLDHYENIYSQIIAIERRYPVCFERFLPSDNVDILRDHRFWRLYPGNRGRTLAQLFVSLELQEEAVPFAPAEILTKNIPIVSNQWLSVLSKTGSNCDAPLWRSPIILIANIEPGRMWPEAIELLYKTSAVQRCRNLVRLGDQIEHSFFERDLDPWRLKTVGDPVNREAGRNDKIKTWKKLPRPQQLTLNLNLQELMNRLEERFNYKVTDHFVYYVPPKGWNFLNITRESWRNGNSFPKDTVMWTGPRHGQRGYKDREERIWVWDPLELHWDVQYGDKKYINVSYTGENLTY